MLNRIKRNILKRRIKSANSEKKAELYRKYYGIKIGDKVRFTGDTMWGTEPYLIEIGDNVIITQDVVFHTHDGGVGLLRDKYPGINIFGKIIIGNNVFIGSKAIILPSVIVGNNVVIAAGCIVSRNIPSNSVVAGIPAKILKSFKEYEEKVLLNAIYVLETDKEKRKQIILKEIEKQNY